MDMQDMIPPEVNPSGGGDRSIRNIPVSTNHRKIPMSDKGPEDTFEAPRRPQQPRTSRRRPVWVWFAGVIVLAALGVIALATMFDSATVTLHPHTAAVTATGPIVASPSGTAGATLTYQTLTVTRSASSTVSASGSQKVSISASGPITIYNTYSDAKQILIANTRFAAPDGKIYRIHSAVTVPGTTKSADGTIKPGTVVATAYADQPGDTFNKADTTQFTIPGFQGDPRYSKFYAQSSGPISGGFVGDQPTIAAADLTSTQTTLKQSLGTSINAAVSGSVPDGFMLVPGSVSVSYADIAQAANGTNSAVLTQSATGNAAIVRTDDIAAALAKQSVQGYNNEPVAFADASAVTISSASTASSSASTGPVSITIAGTPTLVWQFDAAAIKQALVGKPKASFESIIGAFKPDVESADAKLTPFWKSSFPTDPAKINVQIAQ
jgi:hypothetical protein